MSELEARLTAVLAAHGYPGEVMTALDEAWINCGCSQRIPVPVVDLRIHPGDIHGAYYGHVAAALLPALAGYIEDAVTAATCDCGDFDGHPGDCAMWPALRRYEERSRDA